MFSEQNKRFSILMLAGTFVTGVVLTLVGVVIWIDAHPAPGVDPSDRISPLLLISAIVAFGGGVLTQLWAMAKAEQDRQLARVAVATAQQVQQEAAVSRTDLHAKVDELKAGQEQVVKQTNGELERKIKEGIAEAVARVKAEADKAIAEANRTAAEATAKLADMAGELHKIKHSMVAIQETGAHVKELREQAAEVGLLKDTNKRVQHIEQAVVPPDPTARPPT